MGDKFGIAAALAPILLILSAGCADVKPSPAKPETGGATVATDRKGAVMALRYEGKETSAEQFAAAANFSTLRQIYCKSTGLTDESIGLLKDLRQLEIISLDSTGATAKSVAMLAKLPQLRQLELTNSPSVDDAVIETLKGHPTLESLNVSGSSVTDACIDELMSISGLNTLRIAQTEISDAGIAQLAASGLKLEHFSCGAAGLSDASAAAIGRSTSLKTLELLSTGITDAGIDSLASLTNLEVLRISGSTAVTNEGILRLGGLPGLTHLDVSHTNFNANGMGSAGFGSLKILEARSTKLTDEFFPEFGKVLKLRSIKVTGTPVTEECVRKVFPPIQQPTEVEFGAPG